MPDVELEVKYMYSLKVKVIILARFQPSALSNIQLLIPLALPVARPERTDRSSKRDDRVASAEQRAHDESYSSIPAYAFTLDTKAATPRASETSSALPNAVKSHSLYIEELWSRFHAKTKDTAHKSSRDVCSDLASKQTGSSRELSLYICDELMDVLATRCGCCENEHSEDRGLPRIVTSSLSLPWLTLNGRRDTHGSDTIQQ